MVLDVLGVFLRSILEIQAPFYLFIFHHLPGLVPLDCASGPHREVIACAKTWRRSRSDVQ